MTAARLAIGTAQLGMHYGVANRVGQVEPDEMRAILDVGRAAAMDTIDTAIAYGDSETRLGEVGVGGWNVVSKLPPIPPNCSDVHGWVIASVERSLARLEIQQLHALLLHEPRAVIGADGVALRRALIDVQERGFVERIGVSIYDSAVLDELLPVYEFELVQAPLNVFDRRLVNSGWLARLVDSGVEVHSRSTFLQGLLLMSPDTRPAAFAPWRPVLQAWDDWCADLGVSPLRACLGVPLGIPGIARVVVGVEQADQLREIVSAANEVPLDVPSSLASSDPTLIDPSQWASTTV